MCILLYIHHVFLLFISKSFLPVIVVYTTAYLPLFPFFFTSLVSNYIFCYHSLIDKEYKIITNHGLGVPSTGNAAKGWRVAVVVDEELGELPHFRHTVASSDFLTCFSWTVCTARHHFPVFVYIKKIGKVTFSNCVS